MQTGQLVELRVHSHIQDDYVASDNSGTDKGDNSLSAVPTSSAAEPPNARGQEPAATTFEPDTSKLVTSVKIRLADGTRYVLADLPLIAEWDMRLRIAGCWQR